MSDQQLRDLLQERVAGLSTVDLAAHDLAGVAWRDAHRRRARRRTAAVGGVAAVVLAVGGVLAVVDGRGAERSGPGPSTPVPSPTATSTPDAPTATRLGDYRGARVWEAPPAEDELDLPRRTEPSLPGVVDLAAAEDRPVREPVRALFTEAWRAYALTDTGVLFEVDTSALATVTDGGGNRLNPVGAHSLSPDGTHAFFVQDGSLEVLDFTSGAWQGIDVPGGVPEGARWVSSDGIWVPAAPGSDAGTVHHLDGSAEPGDLLPQRAWSGEEPWGPMAERGQRVAQDMFLAGPVAGAGVSNPEAVVVRTGSRVDVLSMWPAGTAVRAKGCCEVFGFLDDDTVLFASKSDQGYRLLAWRVGTGDVSLVSRLAGPGALVDWVAGS